MIKKVDYSAFEKALSSLEEALRSPPKNDLERDGVIQRFEYTFELAWKYMQRHLKNQGRIEISGSPKPVLRDAFEDQLIEDLEIWFGFLDARNVSSHTYNAPTAAQVYDRAKDFPKFCRKLLQRLQQTKS